MNKTQYAIVGGGLSGLCCAIHLKLLKHQVIVFEKSSYPRHKVCGEYLSKEVLPYLQQLGVDLNTIKLPQIDKLQVSGLNGTILESNLPLGAIGVSRYLLENILYNRALELNIPIQTNIKIEDIKRLHSSFEISHQQEKYSTEKIIVATGRKSNLDRILQRKNFEIKSPFVGVKYHLSSKLSIPSNLISLHNFRGGYAGISQIENEQFNFCYLIHQEKLREHKSISKLEENILKENTALRDILENSQSLFDSPLSVQNVSFSAKNSFENGIYFLGDSAGSIAPLCGNGMAMAIHSAQLLADHIHLSEGQNMYEKAWKKSFHTRLKIGQQFQQLLGKNTITNFTLNLLKLLPHQAFQAIITLTHGQIFRSELLDIQEQSSYKEINSNSY